MGEGRKVEMTTRRPDAANELHELGPPPHISGPWFPLLEEAVHGYRGFLTASTELKIASIVV